MKRAMIKSHLLHSYKISSFLNVTSVFPEVVKIIMWGLTLNKNSSTYNFKESLTWKQYRLVLELGMS
jgi:hypothetical protein